MNVIKKGLLAIIVALSIVIDIKAVPPVTSTTVTPGVWCTDFDAALAYAEKNNVPVLAFWGESGCGYCKTLMNQGIDTPKFREWQSKRKPIMIWYHGANKTTPYKNWVRNPASGEWPYVKIYWKKADGKKVEVFFAGRDGKMAVKGGDTSMAAQVSKWITLSTPGQIGGGKPNLNEQLIASFEKYCSSWTMQAPYSGGYFTVPNLPNSRLEAVVGKTTFVNIPLYRNATNVATNKLKVGNAAAVDIVWAKNEKSKMYKYTIPSTVKAKDVISLKLYSDDGKTQKSTSAINVVAEPVNSVQNPKWIGETFVAGEWTMDLSAALAKSKETESYTLALSSGVLWCPFCKSIENNVLNNAKFKEWAKAKNVNLVLLDNPHRPADDNSISVGTKPNGAPPTLLRYAQSAAGVSGAAYMSRKMISVGSASEKNTAEWVLQRNHTLLYKGGDFCAPEGLRTAYPMLILVSSEGKATARILPAYDYDKQIWNLSVEETIARLDELLLLKDANEKSSKPSTTQLSLAIEESTTGSLQVNANTVFYRLSNVPAGKVSFSSTEKSLTLTVYETASTLSAATRLASGVGDVIVNFTSSNNKFLAVSHYSDGLKTYGKGTTRAFTVSSMVTLVPRETIGKFTTKSGNMKMEIVSGKKYKLSGFTSYSAFEKNGDYYIAKSTGVVDMRAKAGTEVFYQIWNPGTVSFVKSSDRIMEADGSYIIKVARKGGASGVAKVSLAVNDGDKATKRVSISPSEIAWQEGDATEKNLICKIETNSKFDPIEVFVVTMKSVSGSVASVETTRFELTVSDTDDPVLPSDSYTYRLYKGIPVNESYDIQNIKENGRVTIKREGDRIPMGLKLKYDKKTKKLMFYGTPSRATSAKFSVNLNERRSNGVAEGEVTDFNVTVVDPKDLKPGDEGYNSVLATGKSQISIIPLFATYENYKVLAGTVEIKVMTTGKLTAKYLGADSKKISFSGAIETLKNNGAIEASLRKKEANMGVFIDSEGNVKVELIGVDNIFASNLTLEGEGAVGVSGQNDVYEGFYTVTLPVDNTVLEVSNEVHSTGTAYLTLDVRSSGKVSVKCLLPNGKSSSFTTYLQPDAFVDEHDVKWAAVPVLKTVSKNTLGAMLFIRENAAEEYEKNPQVIKSAYGSSAYWKFEETMTPFEVYGGYYDSSMNLFKCCTNVYKTATFTLDIETEWIKASETRGAIVDVPSANVTVAEDGKIVVENNDEELKATMKLNRRTGLMTGSIPIRFSNGSKVKASFKGVLLPGWYDCKCGDSQDSIESRPFASGSAVFSDKVNGKSIKRGFAVNLIVPGE